ncbi:hypothetical protein T12_14487 [Trichinella patagoniensis]|uniref:Uncharacterized protein n=1 Tax=Trichinella patagoniensis TaxID=990121 RepID=A0A0V1A8M5_9BILA|nr:hypothetical protein T12_14487 [Trichinella patagoniensis]
MTNSSNNWNSCNHSLQHLLRIIPYGTSFSLTNGKQNTWTAGVSIPVPLACKASALPFELAAPDFF